MKIGQWKDLEKSWRIFAVIAILVLVSVVLNKESSSVIHHIEGKQSPKTSQNISQYRRSRVPEPSTLALFGSGILGMLISFVRRTYAATKRGMDIVGSMVSIIILSPVCLLVTLLIKSVSKGPIIFKQTRLGLNGRPFEIYKFRTMKVDAEKQTGPVWAVKNDNRLIPGGHFLRKTHIDEIPQFINVLKGEMSIIGPRPERPFFVEKFKNEISDYEKRLLVKPGITGLAQVLHRYDETIKDVKIKVRYDLFYIKNMCLLADLRIIFRTIRLVLACPQ